MPVGVLALGAHVPENIVTNSDIGRWAGVTEDWVFERTGVLERRYASSGTTTSDMALAAARQVLEANPEAAEKICALVVATCTPDVPQPSTAAILQHKLGLKSIPSFDVNAVCSGFLYSLSIAESMLSGRFKGGYVLVVGADMFSTIMDRTDRKTVSLFGDGSGAVLVGEVPEGYGIESSQLVADGEYNHYVYVEAGGTRMQLDHRTRSEGRHLFRMDGRAVKDYALATLRKIVSDTLDECRLTLADIDRFVFHQANTRLLEAFARDVGVSMDRFVLTAPKFGNTAAASIPLTLHEANAQRPLQRGERLLLASIGGGMTAAATVLTWY